MRLNGFAWLVILFSFAATAIGENALPKTEPKTPATKSVDAVAKPAGHEDKPSAIALRRLIQSFQNADESARWKAGEELIRTGELAVPALIRAMQDHNASIRREAAFVLARIGSASKPAVPALRAALNDADADVRWYAAFAMRSIESDVRRSAGNSLPVERIANPSVLRQDGLAIRPTFPSAGTLYRADRLKAKQPQPKRVSNPTQPTFQMPVIVQSDSSAEESPVGPVVAPVRVAQHMRKRSEGESADEPTVVQPDAAINDDHLDKPNDGLADSLFPEHHHNTVQKPTRFDKANRLNIDPFAPPIALTDLAQPVRVKQRRPQVAILAVHESSPPTDHLQKKTHSEAPSRLPEELVATARPLEQHPKAGWFRNALRPDSSRQLAKTLGLAAMAWVAGWCLCWSGMLLIRPLWLLEIDRWPGRVSSSQLPGWLRRLGVLLCHTTLLPLFRYQSRVLDAWVQQDIGKVRENFHARPTVRRHTDHLAVPVVCDDRLVPELMPAHVNGVFANKLTRIVVTGAGGIGKSNLACLIGKWAIDRKCCDHLMLPVFIDDESDQPLREIIDSEVRALVKTDCEIPAEMLDSLLSQRRILVIIDRLSEMSRTAQERMLTDLRNLPVAALVVVSRQPIAMPSAAHLHLQPQRISGDVLPAFLGNYLTQQGKPGLLGDLQLFDACRTLSALDDGNAPTALLAKLYAEKLIASTQHAELDDVPQHIPDLMLQHLAVCNRNASRSDPDVQTVVRDLKRIAWLCLKKKMQPDSTSRAEALCVIEGGDAKQRLDYLIDELELVEPCGPEGNRIRIPLAPLAEYLAAVHVTETYADSHQNWSAFLEQVDCLPGPGEAVASFLKAVRECCLAYGQAIPELVPAELGKRAGLEARVIEQSRRTLRIRRLISELAAPNAADRDTAVRALGRMGPEATEAIEPLIETFKDEDAGKLAVEALRNIGAEAVECLTQVLDDEDMNIRRLSAVTLGQIGPDSCSAIPALRIALNDVDYLMRANSARALGLISRDCVPDLIQVLNDEQGYVVGSAVFALGQIGRDANSAVPAIGRALRHEHVEVRRMAADALGRIGDEAMAAIPALINALSDTATGVRNDAAKALGLIGPDAVTALIETLRSEDDALRINAAFALGFIGPNAKAAVRALIKSLQDHSPEMQVATASALDKIHRSDNNALYFPRPMQHAVDDSGYDLSARAA